MGTVVKQFTLSQKESPMARRKNEIVEKDAVEAGTEYLIETWGQANEKGWITLTGLDPYAINGETNLTPDDEDRMVLFIGGMGDAAAWARGDFALYVRNKIRAQQQAEGWSQGRYNEVWGQELDRIARKFAVAPKTLLNNISTCQAWPHESRIAGIHVRYKHHEALPSALDLDDRIAMLRTAEESGWTWARIYGVAHGHLLPDGTPAETAAPVRPAVTGDADAAIDAAPRQEMGEVDDVVANGDYDIDPAAYDDDLPPMDDDDVRNIGAYVMDDASIRIAPAVADSASTPSADDAIRVTLVENGVPTFLDVQAGSDVALYVSFGDATYYTITLDRQTRTLVVGRSAADIPAD